MNIKYIVFYKHVTEERIWHSAKQNEDDKHLHILKRRNLKPSKEEKLSLDLEKDFFKQPNWKC